MRSACLFFLAGGLSAQILINAGGPATGTYSADPGTCSVSGGLPYGPAQQADMKNQAGIYQTLRYGTSFSYDCQVPNGNYSLNLDLFENRPAVATPAIPAAGIGLRVFTVIANGINSGPIDVFAIAGAQTPYVFPMPAIPVTDGHLRIQFAAGKGNAVASGLEIKYIPPVPVQGPTGATGPAGPPGPQGKPGYVSIAVPNPPNITCVAPLSCPVDPANPGTLTIKLLPAQ